MERDRDWVTETRVARSTNIVNQMGHCMYQDNLLAAQRGSHPYPITVYQRSWNSDLYAIQL